jgi:hypothetical protein
VGWFAISIFMGFIVFVALLLMGVNELFDAGDKAAIKSRIENFWYFTAELSTAQKLSEAINFRRRATKRSIPSFLKLFWLLLLLVFLDSSWGVYNSELSDIRDNYNGAISIDLNLDNGIANGHLTLAFGCPDPDCIEETYGSAFNELYRLRILAESYERIVDEASPNLLKIVDTVTTALTIVIVGVPLSLGLLLSFNVTLYILSKITSSPVKLASMLLLDADVALMMPQIIFVVILYIFEIVAISTMGGLVDFSTFDDANLTTFILADSAVMFSASLILPVLFSWNLYHGTSILASLTDIPGTFYLSIYSQIQAVVEDTWKFVHFDFGVGPVESAINWAIFTDLAYSLYFVLPAALLVWAQRWDLGRRMLLNLVEQAADHPKGSLYGFGTILLAWRVAITEIFSGK